MTEAEILREIKAMAAAHNLPLELGVRVWILYIKLEAEKAVERKSKRILALAGIEALESDRGEC